MSAVRRYFCIILSAVMVFCLCSCTGENDDRLITLNVMTVLGDDEMYAVYSRALSNFTSENERVTVKDTTVKTADAYKLGLTDAETYSGIDAPDVICVDFDMINDPELLECFASINTLRETYPDYAQDIIPAAVDRVRAENGIAYCVPLYGEYECMIVSTALSEQYGVSLSASDLAELESAFSALAGAGVLPLADPPEDRTLFFESLVLALGGVEALENGISRDEETLSDVWFKAFEQYERLCVQPVSSADVQPADELFSSGKAAIITVAGKTAAELSSKGGYSVFVLPSDESYMRADFSVGFLITDKACSDPDRLAAAVKYVEYMTSAAQGEKLAGLGLLSSNANTLASPETSLSAQIQQLAVSAQGFVPSISERDRVAADDLSKRLSELSNGLITPVTASQLMLEAQSVLDNEALEAYYTSDTDLSNVQTP